MTQSRGESSGSFFSRLCVKPDALRNAPRAFARPLRFEKQSQIRFAYCPDFCASVAALNSPEYSGSALAAGSLRCCMPGVTSKALASRNTAVALASRACCSRRHCETCQRQVDTSEAAAAPQLPITRLAQRERSTTCRTFASRMYFTIAALVKAWIRHFGRERRYASTLRLDLLWHSAVTKRRRRSGADQSISTRARSPSILTRPAATSARACA